MITLFFNSTQISFIGTSEQIRAKRYDFSQFGPIVSGEGEGWENVARGSLDRQSKPEDKDE